MLNYLLILLLAAAVFSIITDIYRINRFNKQSRRWDHIIEEASNTNSDLRVLVFQNEQALIDIKSEEQAFEILHDSFKKEKDDFVRHLDDIMCMSEDVKSEFLKNRLYREEIENRVKERISKKRKRPKRRKHAA